jgi:hypothetical protein
VISGLSIFTSLIVLAKWLYPARVLQCKQKESHKACRPQICLSLPLNWCLFEKLKTDTSFETRFHHISELFRGFSNDAIERYWYSS